MVKVDNDSQKIYVSLPEAKINSNQLMWDSSMECNEKNNILNPIDFEQYQTLISDIKAEGLREAEKNGLYPAPNTAAAIMTTATVFLTTFQKRFILPSLQPCCN